ncbi:MAG TPA: hypothetical protein VH370_00010, partial [Humisphaera sp.]|nr:hypothetical protein [Humisphaera sp.]
MKQLRRWLLNGVVMLSSLLFTTTAAMWARSFWVDEQTSFIYRGERCRAWLKSGVAGVDNQPYIAAETFKRQREVWLMSRYGGEDGKPLFAEAPTSVLNTWSRSSFLLPLICVGFFGAAPLVHLARWRTARKRRD